MRWMLILLVLLLIGAPAQADVVLPRHPRRPIPERQLPAPAPSAPTPAPEPPRPVTPDERHDEDVPWFLIGSMLVLALSGVHLFWPRHDDVLEKWGIAPPNPRRPEAK